MLYSRNKQVKESVVKYIRALINKKKGKQIDEGALKRRKDFCKLNLEDLELPALEDRYTGAIEEWESFKKDAMEKKE